MKVPVLVLGLYSEPRSGSSIILLGEDEEMTRVLPIFIGSAEAQSIAVGLQGIQTPRPLTHDLMVELMTLTTTGVEDVTVTALAGGTFLAELQIDTTNGMEVVSARPSDAIALAVRLGVQIHVESAVLEEAAVEVRHELTQPFTEEQIEEIVSQFQDFLSTATPSDFETEISNEEE